MNTLSQRDLQQHVMILGWLFVVGNIFYLAVGAFIFVLLTGVGATSGEPEALAVLSIVGTSVGMLLGVLAIPGLFAGYGLLAKKPWARVLAIVVGILGVVNAPLGTVIGLYAFWVLTQPGAAEYFAEPAPA